MVKVNLVSSDGADLKKVQSSTTCDIHTQRPPVNISRDFLGVNEVNTYASSALNNGIHFAQR